MATKKKTPTKEEFVAGFKKASEELKKEADKVATSVTTAKKTSAETAAKAKAASKEAAEKVKTASKTASTKAKTASKKASTSAKKTVAKATAKVEKAANTVKTSAVVQFQGDSYDLDKVTENAIADYHSNSKKALKDIRVYVKPEDHKAYYVANGDYQGSVDL